MTDRDAASQELAQSRSGSTAGLSDRERLKARLRQRTAALEFFTSPLTRADAVDKPLSFSQQRLWVLDQLMGPNPVYNMFFSVRFRGRLDVEALRRSLQAVITRHEALRTRFLAVDGNPQVVIDPPSEFMLPIEAMGSRGEVHAIRRAERGYLFDIAKERLFRARLLQEAQDSHVLVVTLHHLVADAWSLGVLFKELVGLYNGYLRRQPAVLPELAVQFSDYAYWQHRTLSEEVLAEQLRYWKRQLADAPPLLSLPTDRARPAEQGFKGANVPLHIPPDLTAALKELSQAHGATPFMTLLSGFAILLGRYAGQNDVVIGTPVANRRRREIEDLIGFFVNTLVLRTNLSGNPTFTEVLEGARATALQAYAHQDLPFEYLVETLNPERSLGYSPLVQVMFILQNVPLPSVAFDGVTLEHLGNEAMEGFSRLDLTVSLAESREGLRGVVEYNTELFDRDTIHRMADQYIRLLRAIVAAPHSRVAALEFLSDRERQQQHDWNDTHVSYRLSCIHEAVAAQVQRTPEAIAIEQGARRISYAELDRKAGSLARWLSRAGVRVADRVGICLDRSIEMATAILGVLKAGGTYVPIDPDYPRARIEYIIEDAALTGVLSAGGIRERLALAAKSECRWWCLDELDGLEVDIGDAALPKDLTADHSAYVIYTSGSTGAPKGVLGRHGSVMNRLLWLQDRYPVGSAEAFCQKTSIGFVDHVAELFQALTSGSRLVIVPQETVQSPAELLSTLQRSGITRLTVVPSLLHALLSDSSTVVCPSMRLLISSGEALVLKEMESFRQRFPQARLLNLYGSTEVGADVTSYEVLGEESGAVAIGRPIANSQAYVLGSDGQLLPRGAMGELFVGGEGLAQGYWNRGALTAERFVPDPFSERPGARLFRTGDLVRYRDSGELEYLGRADHQVKIRGFRIELDEVDAALRAHSAIDSTITVVRKSARGEDQLVSYVVPKVATDRQTLTAQLKEYLRTRLPHYMVPAAIQYLAALPLNASGKVDRHALPPPLSLEHAHEEPVGEYETLLADLWRDVLQCQRVSRQDNFFELGGHSLLVTRLVAHIRERFKVELPLLSIFEHQTLQAQARLIVESKLGEAHTAGAAGVIRLEDPLRSKPQPLSFAQQRLWFLDRLLGPSPVYNIPIAVALKGSLDVSLLERSLNHVIERHEALRTSFVEVNGEGRQVVRPHAPIPLTVTAIADADALDRAMRVEHAHCFDLRHDGLLRARLLHLESSSGQEHVLLLTLHHIIGDAWSTGVLFRELTAAYRAYQSGELPASARLEVQYLDFAAWQSEQVSQGALEKPLAYWREQLADLPEELTLPTDWPRPATQGYRGSAVRFTCGRELLTALHTLGRQQGATLFMTLFAAFSVLLGRRCAADDFAIGTPIANRTRKEAENLIGFFVNMLVLRCDLRGEPGFKEVLARTRETALQAYAHQDVPFEHLVETLNPGRSLNRSPLFHVVFALQNTPRQEVRIDEVEMKPLTMDGGESVARFDLTLNLSESAQGLAGVMEYSSDLFSRDTIENWVAQYVRLLEQIAAQPDLPIGDYELLTAWDERCYSERLRQGSLAPAAVLAHLSQLPPGQIVLADERGEHTLGELLRQADGLAYRLESQGAVAQECIGIVADASVHTLVAWLAVLKLGSSAYFLPAQAHALRQRFLRDSMGIARVLDASDADGCAGDLKVPELSASMDGEAGRHYSTPLNNGAGLRVHVQHASGRLLAAHWDQQGLLRSLLLDTRNELELPADPVWALCGLSPLVVSMMRALVKGEQWDRARYQGESRVGGCAGPSVLASVILEGRRLAPVMTAGELCLADLHLLQESGQWVAGHPLTPGARVLRTGHRAVVSKDGGCWVVPAPEGEQAQRARRLARESEGLLRGAYQEQPLALVSSGGRWTVFAERASALTLSAAVAQLKQLSEPRLLPVALVLKEALPFVGRASPGMGSIDRERLAAEADEPGAEEEGPQGAAEELLAGIWIELLKCPRVGRHDNFFELGGYSLLSMQLVARIRDVFGVELAIREVFDCVDLKSQAALIQGTRNAPQWPAIEPVDRAGRVPLSFAQQRLWFIDQLEGTSAYHITGAVRLCGVLDQRALQCALDTIVRRHEVLRTTFRQLEGEAIQVIAHESRFALLERDLTQLAAEEQLAAIDDEAAAEAGERFDLSTGPLIRGRLLNLGFKLGQQEHVLLITMHHIVSDGWSVGVFIRELSVLYAAYRDGREDPLAPLPIQYADYGAWQQRLLQGEVLQGQLAYWKAQLSGAPGLIDLPTDRARPPVRSYRGGGVGVVLDATLTQALKCVAQRQGITLFMTLYAGFALLLSKLSGQSDLVIGTPIANRQRTEVEGLIGFFINTLALRVKLADGLRISELLAQVKETTLGAYSYQETPFEHVVEALEPTRSLSHAPVFQAMFALQNAPRSELKLPGLTLSRQPLPETVAQFDLTLSLHEAGEEIRGTLNYASDLFDQSTIERWSRYLAAVYEAMARDVEQPIHALSLLNEQEREQLIRTFNAGEVDYAKDAVIHELFESQVRARPDAIAVVHGDTSLTYAELNRKANQLAHYLRSRGVGPDRLVAICVERSLEMLVGLLGILKAGGAYVPLDPAYPSERLQYMLKDAAPEVVLTQGHLKHALPPVEATITVLDSDWSSIAQYPDHNLAAGELNLEPHHLAYVIYTSGSTGQPKGVMVEHANVVRLFAATDAWFHFNHEDVWTLFHSFAFDFSVWEMYGALLYGGRLVVVSYETSRSPEGFYRLLCREGVTVLNQTPSAFKQLIAAQAQSTQAHQLRLVVFGGEALEVSALKPWYERNEETRPLLVNMYGITETTVHVTYRALQAKDTERLTGKSPIGAQIPDLRIYILDNQHRPVPIGVVGEIYVGGAGVVRGYLNRPELTATRFMRDPFSDDTTARMYKTGDLGCWRADGHIEYAGRNDHQVKIRGFRIELGEIEARLSQHPQIREAAVIARSQEGSSDKRLVAYFTCKEGAPSIDELRSYLRAVLPEHMVPAAYVMLERLPLTENGKLDHKSLPAPDIAGQLRHQHVAPRNAIEAKLCEIWAQVLGVDRVGIEDNYFALGGDSLLSIQLLVRARAAGIDFALTDLFKHQTIVGLAEAVGDRTIRQREHENVAAFGLLSPQERQQLESDDRIEDAYPLTALQGGMYFHTELERDSAVYHDVFTYRIESEFHREPFERAMRAATQRHPILRSSFRVLGSTERLLQVVHKAVDVDVRVEDISSLGERQQRDFIAGWIGHERHQRLVWEKAPLLRIFIHILAPECFQYTLSFHHAILDGWSVASLQTEIFEHYRSLLAGSEVAIAAPKSLYRDYVAAEQQALGCVESREYWRHALDGATPLPLPSWKDAHADQDLDDNRHAIKLDPALSQRISARAQELGVHVKLLLLTAHVKVMSLISGQKDVLTGLVSHGRLEEEDGERALGLYLNNVPLRVQLVNGAWRALIEQVRDLQQAMMPHRRYPLAAIQRALGSRQLFNTFFNFVQFHVYERLSGGGGIKVSSAEGFERTNFSLDVNVSQGLDSDSITVAFAYAPAVFTKAQVECIGHYFEAALQSLADGLDVSHRQDVLLTKEEQRWLRKCNETDVDRDDTCIHDSVAAQAQSTPSAIAVVDRERSVTYAQLEARAAHLASVLVSRGIAAGDRVGICLERSIELVVSLLGVLKAGGTYVAIDPEYPKARIEYILEDAAVTAVLSERSVAASLGAALDKQRWWYIDELEKLELDAASVRLPVKLSADHAAYVIYTSGSTGVPKGVVGVHGSVMNRLQWLQARYPIGAGEVFCQKTSVGFVDHVAEIFQALTSGGRLVIVAKAMVQSPGELLDKLNEHGITRLTVVPSLLHALLSEASGQVCASLRLLITSGEALVLSAGEAFSHRFPNARLLNLYGSTEVGADVMSYEVAPGESGAAPIGRPIANSRIYVLSSDGELLPRGSLGELYVGGAGLAQGYLQRASLTADRFVPDPFSERPGARLFRTGDLVRYRDSGEVEYLGRADHQVKIRGMRIELGEIESCLGAHPGVQSCVVVAREDEPGDWSRGGGDVLGGEKRLVAYYTGKTSALDEDASENSPRAPAPSVEELREHLKSRLPEYMVPAAFVALKQLPLTPNGKVDRKALPAPGGESYAQAEYEAPQGDIEATLAQIWQRLLKVERVGRQDNFFELGGHSLLAVQVVSRVRQVLGRELAVRAVFERATIQSLAAHLTAAGRANTQPIEPADRQRPLPMSWSQERLWFIDQLEGESAAYHLTGAVRLHGELDRGALRAALDTIVERHEVLRTRFQSIEEQAIQQIVASGRFSLQERDLSKRPEALHIGQAVEHEANEERNEQFDLSTGPLIRGRLLKLRDDDHVLLVTMHHIVSDGWSIGIFIRELSTLYAAYREGRPNPLPPLAVQYADYAQWQRRWLQAEVLQGQLDYWQRHLKGAPALLELPADRLRPAVQTYRGANTAFTLDAQLSAQIRQLAKQHDATLFMALYAGFALLLSKLSGQQDIVIGVPMANRSRAEVEPLIGFFVNTLALRTGLTRERSVSELLAQVKETTLGAYAHQETPFEQVVEALQPQRSLSYSPVFQVLFTLQNAPQSELSLPGLKLAPQPLHSSVAQFDLTLSLQEKGDEIVGVLNYASDLFDARTVERWGDYLKTVYAQMARDAHQSLHGICVLSAQERNRVLREFNATAVAYPPDALIHQLFEAQVQCTPHTPAVIDDHGSLTYAQLNARANQLARHLRACGVGPDQLVAICLERSLSMVVGLLGIMKAGGAYVPLDPGYPRDRLEYMLRDAAPRVVLTQESLRERLPESSSRMVSLDGDAREIQQLAHENLRASKVGVTASHLAYLIYTSGSTGTPKGVMIEHRNTANLLYWAREALETRAFEHTLASTSLNFDLAVYECFVPLSCGGTLRVVGNALQVKRSDEITLINTVPSAMTALLESAGVPPGTRFVNLAGEALKRSLVERIFAETDVESVCNLYGPSETTTYSTWVRMRREEGFNPTIGRPVANTQIYLLDSEGHPVPLGVVGEIHIGGAGVARGYLNRPELTSERFLRDPFSPDARARMYKTGDLGRWWLDGTLEYLGRNDHQVKIRGFRIELGEIESRLLQHPNVQACVVVAREDVPGDWSRGSGDVPSGDKRLVAYFSVKDGTAKETAPTLNDLREHLGARLPEYMVPAAFVLLEQLPLTPNGKVDRQALPAPGGDAYSRVEYEAPVGETEEQLARIWQALLKVERVGRGDNFFELGGHSLLTVQLMERLRQAGLHGEVQSVFKAATLKELASTLQRQVAQFAAPANRIPAGSEVIEPWMLSLLDLSQSEIDEIVARVPGGAKNVQDLYPLAPLQEGILFHHALDEKRDPYVLPILLELATREKLAALLGAFQSVIDRHDILRTAVLWKGLKKPVQVVHRKVQLPVHELKADVELTSDVDVVSQLKGRMAFGRMQMNPEQAPLLRMEIALDARGGKWYALILLHHLAIDHMSLERVLMEVAAHMLGRAGELLTPMPYREYVAQAVARANSGAGEAFFRRELGAVEEPTAPFGLLNVRGDGSDTVEAQQPVEPELAARVRRCARRLGTSAATVFHVAYALVVAHTSARNEVVFGSILSGRLQGTAGAGRALGMFINTLPIRIALEGRSVQDVLESTRDLLIELVQHEQMSLTQAQRLSGMDGSLPLFSAVLNYRHSAPKPPQGTSAEDGIRLVAVHERTNYPFAVSVDDFGEEFALSALTDQRVDPHQVTRYVHLALELVVAALEQAPHTLALHLPIIPESARANLNVTGWQGADQGKHGSLRLLESLLRRHAGVRDVAVEREESFGGPGKIVAYCVSEAAVTDLEDADFKGKILALLRGSPEACCLPSAVVPVERIVRLANGKADFSKLPSPFAAAREQSFEWPVGLYEELLGGIWSALLKCERVGRNANFFKLGGYSLLGMQLVTRIREVFAVELPLREVFECEDLKSQAELIQRSRLGAHLPAIEVVDRSKSLPLSFAQQRLWFLSRMMPANAVYNIPLALKLTGDLNEAALVAVLTQIVHRHEALRTRFMEVNGQAAQIIDAPREHCVVVEEVDNEDALRARCAAEREHCFDLSQGPLYRLRLLRTRWDGHWALLATFHHIIADGWSLGVFFKELSLGYRAAMTGQTAPAEPLRIQYADYAHWQRQNMRGEALGRQRDYWREQLRGLPPSIALPYDFERPEEPSSRGAAAHVQIPKPVLESVRNLGLDANATLFMTLLAAFSVLLYRRCAEEDIPIGTPVANRAHSEAQNQIGFFVNMLVLRCDLGGAPSFREVLSRIREMALQAYAHQDIPFEYLVETLNPERHSHLSPLFQVAFALQDTLRDDVRIEGIEVAPVPSESAQGVARYELTFSFHETPSGLTGAVEYSSDLFAQDTIENLLAQYALLLEQIAADPQQCIDDYDLTTSWDRNLQLEWQDGSEEPSRSELCSPL